MTPLIAALVFYYQQILIYHNYDKVTLRNYAVVESLVAGVNPQIVLGIIDHEDKDWTPDAVHYNDMKKGCNSIGLAQIRDCNHPDVSYEQATNPVFAINFIIQNIDKCKTWWRSTCPLQNNG